MASEVMDVSTRSKNHDNENTLDFWKVIAESYKSNVKQNHSTELVALSNFKF